MKKIVLMLMMAVAAISAHAQKYALVDMEYILKNVPAYERANEQLNQVSRKWQAEVEALISWDIAQDVLHIHQCIFLCMC